MLSPLLFLLLLLGSAGLVPTSSAAAVTECKPRLRCHDSSTDGSPTIFSTQVDAQAAYVSFCTVGCTNQLPSSSPSYQGRHRSRIALDRRWCNLLKHESGIVQNSSSKKTEGGKAVTTRHHSEKQVKEAEFHLCCVGPSGEGQGDAEWTKKAADYAGFNMDKCELI
ncbi:uncharacterized protein PSFLO_06112 [Pseudozyma flocculosa]|nr:uncharacterized protein PSFLO_06112 [Pseudozyma flocculosa]